MTNQTLLGWLNLDRLTQIWLIFLARLVGAKGEAEIEFMVVHTSIAL